MQRATASSFQATKSSIAEFWVPAWASIESLFGLEWNSDLFGWIEAEANSATWSQDMKQIQWVKYDKKKKA